MQGKFRDFINLNEKITNLDEVLDSEIITLVLKSLQLSVQTHIYHWLTKSLAEHSAIGGFYSTLRGLTDSLAEISIGMNLEVSAIKNNTPLTFEYDIFTLLKSVKGVQSSCN
jgi:DNA-binding ferritin-like protein